MVRVWLSRNARFEYWFSFKIRRRRSLIRAQFSSLAKTLGNEFKLRLKPERVRRSAKPLFRVWVFSYVGLKVVAALQPLG